MNGTIYFFILLKFLAILKARQIFNLRCITKTDDYCHKKLDNFKFFDGCSFCTCHSQTVLCYKSGCSSKTTNIYHLFDYCKNILKQNERRYSKFVLLKKTRKQSKWRLFKNARNETLVGKNKLKHNLYQNDTNHFRRPPNILTSTNNRHLLFTKRFRIINKIKYFRKRLRIFHLKKFRLIVKRRKILRRYRNIKKHYLMSKKLHSFSLKTRFLKYRYKRYSKKLKKISKKIMFFYYKTENIKSEIKRLEKKLKHFPKKPIKRKIKHYKDSKKLTELKRLYLKEKKHLEHLKKKKDNLIKLKNTSSKKYSQRLRLQLFKIYNQIKIEEIYLYNLRTEILKLEGVQRKSKHKESKKKKSNKKKIGRKKSPKKDNKKRRRTMRKNLKDKVVQNSNTTDIPSKIYSSYLNIFNMLGNRKFKENNSTDEKSNPMDKFVRNLVDNHQISKKLVDIKQYFAKHLASDTHRNVTNILEKLKQILPFLMKIKSLKIANITDFLERNKQHLLDRLSQNDLRMANDKMYRKYLKLIRLKFIENKLHKRLNSTDSLETNHNLKKELENSKANRPFLEDISSIQKISITNHTHSHSGNYASILRISDSILIFFFSVLILFYYEHFYI